MFRVGDGVNDVGAMTEAEVSCAMMSFGNEEPIDSNTKDVDNFVRTERLKRRRIGSNRLSSIRANSLTEEECIGIGETPAAASFRIQKRISEQLKDSQTNASSSTPFNIVLSSIMDEVRRYRKLKKGGSAAASILAEEDRLRRSMQQKARDESQSSVGELNSPDVKTGEACLAATFTLLRPSIAGVETIIRCGIAAASSSIALYRKVTLGCILSCYNLATIYKNGLRYGKWLWQCELLGIIYTDRSSFTASSMPRSRLVADTRPPSSPFHAADILSTACQAMIHIVTLTLCVKNGKKLEATRDRSTQNGFRIKWTSSNNEKGSIGAILASLVDTPGSSLSSCESTTPQQSLFRRSPFEPNHGEYLSIGEGLLVRLQ